MADTKVGPAITSANIPRPAVPSPLNPAPQGNATTQATINKSAQMAMDDSPIVAAPLIEPDFVNLKPTNPNISFRWILHTLYKKDGTQSILRFEQAKAQGYAVACKADIKNPPVAYELEGGTKYVNGDLILMKIDRRKYQGAILHREQKAVKQMLATGKKGHKAVGDVASGLPSNLRGKIQSFDPTADLRKFAESGDIDGMDDALDESNVGE